MEDTMIAFGPYILPFPIALTAILSVFYSLFNKPDSTNVLSDRFKNGLALLLGMSFGMLVMIDRGVAFTTRDTIGWLVFGLLEGAATVGLYKSVRIQSGKE